MPRTLPGALETTVQQDVTAPRHLLYIAFPAPLRLCSGASGGSVSSLGETWVKRHFTVKGLTAGVASSAISVAIDDSDQMMTALLLNNNAAGLEATVYNIDASSPGDAVEAFHGVVDTGVVDIDDPVVTFQLLNTELRSPRQRIGVSTGFNVLIPAGTQVTIAGQTYILER